ncbi:hypothetical protein BDR04DRAFT_1151231 [Suillus decipiens]|nr:hypothetical protein BDR04DRAFT_1151231 [Suillus decipiens]
MSRSQQEEFLRRVRESSGTYPPLAHVAPSHCHGSSGIEQIESDSDEDEEEDGTETDSDEEEYWTDTDSDDVDGRGFQN